MAKRWTTEEEKVIMKYVRLNPSNLTKAFKLAELELDRTYTSIVSRYYMNIKKSEVLFTLVSKEVVTVNSKNGNLQKSSNIWNLISRSINKIFKFIFND